MAELTGITWNHTRGLLPMVATAQRFNELQPEISIAWQKRSLQQFADAPLADLAARFDLLVLDHPSIGEAAAHDLLLPLDQFLPAHFLADQAANSVGGSHASYLYNDHLYALAIDAATPIAGWRSDLLARADAELPHTWDDLLALARRGLVTLPAIPIDSLMHLFMLSNALETEPFAAPGEALSPPAVDALRLLRELVQLVAPGSLDRNPIATWQLLADSSSVAYCPFAYGYSNYSREGYAAHRIDAGALVQFNGKPLRSTLGGAGLAISRRVEQHVQHRDAALAYAQFVTSPETQRTLYTTSGGQPGHRSAWLDPEANRLTHGFFQSTLPVLDAAWVRPRFAGFIAFQNKASHLVHEYLRHGGSERNVLEQINAALRHHRHAHEVSQ